MIKYINYFKYIMEHKKNVFIECWKLGNSWFKQDKKIAFELYMHAFTHDLSKFSPSEFIPYAINFYSKKDCRRCAYYLSCDYNQIGLGHSVWAEECKDYKYNNFNKALEHHYKHNKHHWNYWEGKDIPEKYIRQMICDWKAMSRKFGGTAQEFYMKNYDKINISHRSRLDLEFELGLLGELIIHGITWKDYCDNIGITMEEDLKRLGYIK